MNITVPPLTLADKVRATQTQTTQPESSTRGSDTVETGHNESHVLVASQGVEN